MIAKFRYLVLFLSVVGKLFGQTYNFTQYVEESGLAQSYVYCISQSVEGLLTLTTGEAVCTFDGNQFSTFTNKQMVDDIISTHYTDSRNITWLAHRQNGLAFIKNGRYFKVNNVTISNLKITQIIEDDKKYIWLATSGGLFTIDSTLKIAAVEALQNRSIHSICFDKMNNLLAGTSEGLILLSVSPTRKIKTLYEIDLLKNKNIKQIEKAGTSRLNFWVLVDGEGIYGYTNKNGKYELSSHILEELNSENFDINYLFSDDATNLWVSVFGDGLRKISFRGEPLLGNFIVETFGKKNGLKSQNIQTIFQDSEGNMWFGTFGDGLIKKPVEMFSFFGTEQGLITTNIKKVITDTSGNFWMATEKGLAYFEKKSGLYILYTADNGFISDQVNTLLLDAGNILWIGTNANGIYTMDVTKHKFTNFSKQKHLSQLTINSISETETRMMVGTTDGLYIKDKLSEWSETLTTSDGLLHNNVLHVFEDSKKRLWISSHGAAPYFIKSQKITYFKKIAGLNSFKINSVCEDKEGNIWIATDGDGVFKYNNEIFSNYTTSQGLLSDYCNGIVTDKNNSLWVTHRSGLSELKVLRKHFTNFSGRRGLLFYENNLNGVYKDANANLWFATTQGIVKYNPESEYLSAKIPDIFVSTITFNNRIHSPKDLIIKEYGYYAIHIDFKAISLSEPEAIYYKYRLTDIDSTWKTTLMPYVDFPKLGDGDYTFQVMACNVNSDLCVGVPASIIFKITAPVWKNLWFYLLLLALLIIITYVIVLIRIKSLKQTQAILELKVEQKTHLLQCEKKEVEKISLELKIKNTDITSSIHYAKNIQDSLLPPEGLLKELFNANYFVLFKPKDIVSGDFYWCMGPQVADALQLHLIAAIDCTGHGVPGAFLSILANDFLKQSVVEKNVNSPNEILDFLNKNIRSHLNQSLSKQKLNDGMDLSLIGIDYTNKKLYYSGANNPIYIFRQGPKHPEEIIIKATKQAIGSAGEKLVNFDLRIIDLRENDIVYLFTDGYADQFGGPNDKKLTYKRFRSILSEAYHLPMIQQKNFIDTKFEAWKNGTEQTDDVCVIGIKI